MSETTDHQALADFLHNRAAPRLPLLSFVWHTANESAGGAKAANGVPLDVLREARMGVIPGVWDWLYVGGNQVTIDALRPGYFFGVAVELKSKKAFRTANHGLSDEQIRWRKHYIVNGWYTAVFSEWTEAAALLVRWVGGNPADFGLKGAS